MPDMSMDAVLIVTSCGSCAEAEAIAEVLVGERLAACVQLLPATSVYRWQGAVERAEEVVLHIKTRGALAGRVGERVGALHGYDLPELIVVPIAGGSADYLAWIAREVGQNGPCG